MSLQEPITAYHDLLSDELAGETQHQLDEQLRSRGLFFGDRPLCTVLRPRFITPEQYRFLQARIAVLLSAFDRAHHAALGDADVRAQFRLLPWEEDLVQQDHGFADASPVSRLDAFFVSEKGGLRFTEYNAETPAGAAYGDLLAEVFLGLPIMREFLHRHQVRPLPARHLVLHALTTSFHQWLGRREAPRIGILDWREVPTFSEFLVSVDYFRSQGVECVIADPREVEYRDGKLMAGDFHITLIYKRVLISELVERGGLDHPIIRAVRDGAVCMINPFRCKILHKKASLAVLSDERNAHLFPMSEREAIESHIPWTRVVEERRTSFRGETVELIPFMQKNRERLVLKPNDDYGGAGIVLGWETDTGEWERSMRRALEEPYVVQERVTLPTELYPSLVDGRVQFADRMLDTAPFCFHGAYMDGCLTRLGTAALLNVTAGGGSSVPTFLVMKR
jgi:glutathionylspermidine synthase